MVATLDRIPSHLRKYVVEQHYSRYTPEDQAVWRFIMRQLKDFLSRHAHSDYVEGLKKTGIDVNYIPKIEVMNQKLEEFGWGAVPVSGFIPPAAFMEFQSLGLLPIASDMRSIEHLTYTPAPDIVHEAAGHAPILIQPKFAAYLKKYAEVAYHAIITKEDMQQYQAIRELSDIKENPNSTPQEIKAAEDHLVRVNNSMTMVSEAGWLSRMNWWTAEYGLIGDLSKPQIFGAGLLSSVGESRWCLSNKVKKIPLSVDCIHVSYDITEPQPQLFVTPDFETLHSVLEELAEKMAFRLGGIAGVQRAQKAQAVCTVVLDSGLAISGVLSDFLLQNEDLVFLRFAGPSALAIEKKQLMGHGTDYHKYGFSSPLGRPQGLETPLHRATISDLRQVGIEIGRTSSLKFDSGIELIGRLDDVIRHEKVNLIFSFSDCTVKRGEQLLFQPEWGQFDLAAGEKVISVYGGAADRAAYGDAEGFAANRVPIRKISPAQQKIFSLYQEIREFREQEEPHTTEGWRHLFKKFLQEAPNNWLLGVELLEIARQKNIRQLESDLHTLEQHLELLGRQGTEMINLCVQDGVRLASQEL